MRVAALCAELARLLERRTGSDGGHETAIAELTLWRFSWPTELTPGIQQPAIYVVVQWGSVYGAVTRLTRDSWRATSSRVSRKL
jgi:hypothetical protein